MTFFVYISLVDSLNQVNYHEISVLFYKTLILIWNCDDVLLDRINRIWDKEKPKVVRVPTRTQNRWFYINQTGPF